MWSTHNVLEKAGVTPTYYFAKFVHGFPQCVLCEVEPLPGDGGCSSIGEVDITNVTTDITVAGCRAFMRTTTM